MSAAPDVIPDEAFAQELTCPICLEMFDQPRRLSCSHSFCHKCIVPLLQSTGTTLRCPECRECTQLALPGHLGVARLPIDHRAVRMVEMYDRRARPRDQGRDGSDGEGDGAQRGGQGRRGPAAAREFEHVEMDECAEPLAAYVPFEMQAHSCQEMFDRWKKGLWLCPTDFGENARLQSVRTAFVPFYVFSVDVCCNVRAVTYCPQDGKTALPTCEARVTTEVSNPPAQQIVATAEPAHPSQSWKREAVGMTVTQSVRRDIKEHLDAGWGTWLWEQAAPWLGGVVSSGKADPGGCCSEGNSPKSAAGAAPPAAAAGIGYEMTRGVRVDNCEAQLKLGQTFVSTTMPRQRKIELSGRHCNTYSNILVCASHAVDHDLVAGLMTGRNKDLDLTQLQPVAQQQGGHYSDYLREVHNTIFRESGQTGGGPPQQSPQWAAAAAGAQRRAPAADREDAFGGFGDFQTPKGSTSGCSSPPHRRGKGALGGARESPAPAAAAAAAAAGGGARSGRSPDLFDFFGDTDAVAAHARPSDFWGSQHSDDRRGAPLGGGMPDFMGSDHNNEAASPAEDGRARMFGAAGQEGLSASIAVVEEHFGGPVGTRSGASAAVQLLGKEVLTPERRSSETWQEQVLPVVRDNELAFTRNWLEQQAPKGAVVDELTTELTVTSVEHRAVLLPCFLATYTYEGRWYDLVVHGRSGEVHGKRPWMGSGTIQTVRRGIQGRVDSLKQYLEQSLDQLGVS